jgi:hypothetical protein
VEICAVEGSDDFLRGFSQRAIPQHAPDADGHGRGRGIGGQQSQAGQPQPRPATAPTGAATVRAAAMGSSSRTVHQRALDDEVERLTQVITDRIVELFSKG